MYLITVGISQGSTKDTEPRRCINIHVHVYMCVRCTCVIYPVRYHVTCHILHITLYIMYCIYHIIKYYIIYFIL